MIISSFDFNLFKPSLISRSRNKLCITSHHASSSCLIQLYSISLSQKVDLRSLLDVIVRPSLKYFRVYLSYLIVHTICEEIFIPVEVHGIEMKGTQNDNKTTHKAISYLKYMYFILSLQIK